MKTIRILLLPVLLLGAARPGLAEEAGDWRYFGEEAKIKGTLIGMIYDLKQTQKGEPSGVDPANYASVVKEFLDRNWDESVLNRFFRSSRPLYTTQVFIPMIGAGEAPKAFNVDDVMKPSCWVVHYKGQVSPPEDGTYRFMAFSDDMIVIAVNGKMVVNGSLPTSPVAERKHSEDRPKFHVPAASGGLMFSDWFPAKKDELLDLDVLVGERPGGGFCAFMMVERMGATYEEGPNGVPKYPVFQLAPFEMPESRYPAGRVPAYSTPPDAIWTAYP